MEGREREGPQVTVEPGPLTALLRHWEPRGVTGLKTYDLTKLQHCCSNAADNPTSAAQITTIRHLIHLSVIASLCKCSRKSKVTLTVFYHMVRYAHVFRCAKVDRWSR